jgi:hypothetical protein
MTDAQIENLIKLAGEATPGPWRHVVHGMHDIVEFKSCYYSDSLNSQEAEHIAACSPEVITELCTTLKKYRAELERYRDTRLEMRDNCAVVQRLNTQGEWITTVPIYVGETWRLGDHASNALAEKEHENG